MMKSLRIWMIVLLLSGSFLSAGAQDSGSVDENADERHFDALVVGKLSFTNVWVHRQTNAVILIRHSMGIHSIKLSDLPSDELVELKAQIGDLAVVSPKAEGGWRNSPFVRKVMGLFGGSSGRSKIILGCVAFLVVLLVIVKTMGKTRTEAG